MIEFECWSDAATITGQFRLNDTDDAWMYLRSMMQAIPVEWRCRVRNKGKWSADRVLAVTEAGQHYWKRKRQSA